VGRERCRRFHQVPAAALRNNKHGEEREERGRRREGRGVSRVSEQQQCSVGSRREEEEETARAGEGWSS